MSLHKGTTYAQSCVKVPLHPFSRQPNPLYERPCGLRIPNGTDKHLSHTRIMSARTDHIRSRSELSSVCDEYAELFDSIPDYRELHELNSDQFKRRLDCLKRRQRLLLKNLRNCLEQDEAATNFNKARSNTKSLPTIESCVASARARQHQSNKESELQLKGKKCNLERSRNSSRATTPCRLGESFSCLAEDQDLLTYRHNVAHELPRTTVSAPESAGFYSRTCKEREKAAKTRRNERILSACKYWSSGSESKSVDSDEHGVSVETKSLPPCSPRRLQSVSPRSFVPRDSPEKSMTPLEQQAVEEYLSCRLPKKIPTKKRRIRPIPLTSKIPMYDKLLAEKEARSRLVREVSALSLMSQVRPFKLECERRALRALTRSSPELGSKCCSGRISRTGIYCGSRFRARPVPRNLFSSEIYDRMLEEEFMRNLQKRIRSVELLKSASLPASMARRERCKSANTANLHKSTGLTSKGRTSRMGDHSCRPESVALNRGTPLCSSEKSRASTLTTTLPPNGTNLAAILRAQASREKLEREIQEKMEENRREQMLRLRKALIGRKPAWRALRSAARHEHERDLDFRASLRRDEARIQAEQHRLQMEMMLDRVTQIPTLFERYSQSYQQAAAKLKQLQPRKNHRKQNQEHLHRLDGTVNNDNHKTNEKQRQISPSSADSYASSRPDSGSMTSSSGLTTCCPSSVQSSGCKNTQQSSSCEKKRGLLKVSINEKAELIDDLSADSARAPSEITEKE
ncbi:hypothetical protein QAD02_005227 [Eretmocerus hayati]|uniref:Uncharacterized protein n=1 Tax=Eretmocerus hayati TaxID=131215 RepID=A0ACC2NWN6_9HYME|nr:hypothetical protein QAD02_005227 [Eretmocerus hayati]